MNVYQILKQTAKLRVSDGEIIPILADCEYSEHLLVLIWSQLGDFDNLEYAWWLKRSEQELAQKNITIRAVGIGDRNAGVKFCEYTGFPESWLFVDPEATIHQELGLYEGLKLKLPFFNQGQNAWLNFLLMCAGIGSKGTLKEVLRGYLGDKDAPQLIDDDEVIEAKPLPPLKGSFFKMAGGKGFQRPFELATIRLRNMTEVLTNWSIYVPNSAYLTQRGATFLFDNHGNLLYEHQDQGILDFAENKSNPLNFIIKLEL
jgi:hypothetical protein